MGRSTLLRGVGPLALVGLLALGATAPIACVPGSPADRALGPGRTTEDPSTSKSAAAPTAPLAPLPGAVVVAPPAATPLPYSLVAIAGEDAVLAVHQTGDDDHPTIVQRFDGKGRVLDEPFSIGGSVASAFTGEGGWTLLTQSSPSLCVEHVRGSKVASTWCEQTRADAVVQVGGRLLALALDPPPPEDEDEARPERPPPKKRAVAKPPKKRQPKKGRPTRGEGARETRRPSDEATAPARRKLALLGHWLEETDEQRLARETAGGEDPFDTGVRVEEPMAGLGIVGAGRRTMRDGSPRIDVVFHEWVGTKGAGPKALGRARFGVVGLDATGKEVEGTRGHFSEADLFFGFLGGEVEPQLWTFDGGSVLLTANGLRGACRATVVSPSRVPFGPVPEACSIDPGRLLTLVERQRKKATSTEERDREVASDRGFQAMAQRLVEEGAHRAEGQARWDGPLAVLGPTRGFTQLASGALRSWDRTTFEVREEPRPLVVQRARAYRAAIAPDGEALVATHDGLRLVRVDGTVEKVPTPFPNEPLRRDEADFAHAPFAKIGASWWTSGPMPRRLWPAATSQRSPGTATHPDAVRLVGGATEGMLLELDGTAMEISSLDADGRFRRLTRVPSPVLPGFDAAPRDGGGALVIGMARGEPDRMVTFAIDATGKVGALGARYPITHGQVAHIAAIPGRGAVTVPVIGGHTTWVDPDGAALGEADVTRMRYPVSCVDGIRMPGGLPGAAPATRRSVPELERHGACVVGMPAWDASGATTVILSRLVGAHVSVERLRIEPDAAPPPAPTAGARPRAPTASPAGPARGQTRCPAEMVLVDDRVCVDRYEAVIAEGATGRLASPDFPITPNLFNAVLGDWATRRERVGDAHARAMPLPRPAPFQLGGVEKPVAVSRVALYPSAYLTGLVAKEVCATAGKRLCTKEEWRTACRGEKRTRFPYGESYEEGVCNVANKGHPAAILHGHASLGHLDPRLGRVLLDETAGLWPTGSHTRCASRWGDDAIYDMVGNLDEWVDAKGGAFAGGFYARGTTSGCDALVDSHPPPYLDYSTGVRCCATASSGDR